MAVMCRKCKNEMKEKHGTFIHKMFGKEITLENVPYYACEGVDCNNQFYSHQKSVEEQLTTQYWQE